MSVSVPGRPGCPLGLPQGHNACHAKLPRRDRRDHNPGFCGLGTRPRVRVWTFGRLRRCPVGCRPAHCGNGHRGRNRPVTWAMDSPSRLPASRRSGSARGLPRSRLLVDSRPGAHFRRDRCDGRTVASGVVTQAAARRWSTPESSCPEPESGQPPSPRGNDRFRGRPDRRLAAEWLRAHFRVGLFPSLASGSVGGTPRASDLGHRRRCNSPLAGSCAARLSSGPANRIGLVARSVASHPLAGSPSRQPHPDTPRTDAS